MPCCRRATGAATGRQQEPPAPLPGTWGDLAGKVHVLASDPKDGLAAALARLGRAFMARNS